MCSLLNNVDVVDYLKGTNKQDLNTSYRSVYILAACLKPQSPNEVRATAVTL